MKSLEEATWNAARSLMGIAVIYRRGGEGINLTVVPGMSGNQYLSFKGKPLQDPTKIFTAGVADLRNFYPPKTGDVIQFRETGQRYAVSKEATGAAYNEIGGYGTMIQIHTVEEK